LIHAHRGDHADVIEKIKELFEKFQKTGHKIDACFLISDSYVVVGKDEREFNDRKMMFNGSTSNLNTILKYARSMLRSKDPEVRSRGAELTAKVNMKVGAAYEVRVETENRFGLRDVAKEASVHANATYLRVFQYSAPETLDEGSPLMPSVVPYVERAFIKVIPYEIAAGRHADIVVYCKDYMTWFGPKAKYREKAAQWSKEASAKVAAGPAPKIEPKVEPAPATNTTAAGADVKKDEENKKDGEGGNTE
jgi:hypothetical protein